MFKSRIVYSYYSYVSGLGSCIVKVLRLRGGRYLHIIRAIGTPSFFRSYVSYLPF